MSRSKTLWRSLGPLNKLIYLVYSMRSCSCSDSNSIVLLLVPSSQKNRQSHANGMGFFTGLYVGSSPGLSGDAELF